MESRALLSGAWLLVAIDTLFNARPIIASELLSRLSARRLCAAVEATVDRRALVRPSHTALVSTGYLDVLHLLNRYLVAPDIRFHRQLYRGTVLLILYTKSVGALIRNFERALGNQALGLVDTGQLFLDLRL